MFINLTNHPSVHWSKKQRAAAQEYGEILDLPFPLMKDRASVTPEKAFGIVRAYLKKIEKLKPKAILCAGDFYMTFLLTDAFKKHGYLVLVTLSNRRTTEIFNDDGTTTKTSVFDFIRFQEYEYYTE